MLFFSMNIGNQPALFQRQKTEEVRGTLFLNLTLARLVLLYTYLES